MTMMSIIIKLAITADFSDSHNIMSQFVTYLSNEQSPIPIDFLLPFERKMIKFNNARQRKPNERDTNLLVGAFVICKVLVQRLLFKPYKIRKFYEETEFLTDDTII